VFGRNKIKGPTALSLVVTSVLRRKSWFPGQRAVFKWHDGFSLHTKFVNYNPF